MVFLALFLLPLRVYRIFAGFTFTDVEDFLPLLSLLIGLSGIASIYRSSLAIRHNASTKENPVSRPLYLLLLLLSLWPVLPTYGAFFLALELQSVQGHWPQVMVDDPKGWYESLSPRFDALFDLMGYLEAFSGAWMILFFVLLSVVRRRLTRVQFHLCLAFLGASLLLFVIDPGNFYTWWMD